jgi:pimeloyl-ACP methyl ester carboxylesterase
LTWRWCVRIAAPEIYHRIEPAGTILEFDDEGTARAQRDAETIVAHFDAAAGAALDWLDERRAVPRLVRLVTAPVGISPFARLSILAYGRRRAGTPRARMTASWLLNRTQPRLPAPEIKGDLLLIFGTRDRHTPEAGGQVVRRGWRRDYRRGGDPPDADNAGREDQDHHRSSVVFLEDMDEGRPERLSHKINLPERHPRRAAILADPDQ